MNLVSSINSSSKNFFSGFNLNNPTLIIKRTMTISIPIFIFLGVYNAPTVSADYEDVARCMMECKEKGNSDWYCGFICAAEATIKWYIKR